MQKPRIREFFLFVGTFFSLTLTEDLVHPVEEAIYVYEEVPIAVHEVTRDQPIEFTFSLDEEDLKENQSIRKCTAT